MANSNSRKSATIEDVAKLAGLSIATVSRYINRSSPVSPQRAALIEAAIIELNFVPKTAAQILARNRTNTIGLLLPVISGNFFGPILRGIEARSIEDGYALLVHSTEISAHGPFKRVLAEHNTDGLIVFTTSLDEVELRRLEMVGHPVVLIFRSSPEGSLIPSITVENKKGARQLIDHLIEIHGCQRIVYLRGPEDHEDSGWREAGYKESLAAHQMEFDSRLVGVGNFNADDARIATRRLIDSNIEFDAIFAGDDESASGALMTLRENKIQVPEDVKVVGFDDLNLAQHLSPALTTVRSPIYQVGHSSAELLIDLLKGKSVPSQTLLPIELVIRNSCGCQK